MQRQNTQKIINNSDGFAVVEATFVFPVMFMIFFTLFLLAVYLPQRAILQRATQYAATAVATEMGDTWLYYSDGSRELERYNDHDELSANKGGVYVTLFKSIFGAGTSDVGSIVETIDESENIPVIANGDLTVECEMVNYVVYKEIVVTAIRAITLPVDFSIIGVPKEIELIVSSKAVVQNGDEFIRNVDLVVYIVDWVRTKSETIDNFFKKVGEAGDAINGFFGL